MAHEINETRYIKTKDRLIHESERQEIARLVQMVADGMAPAEDVIKGPLWHQISDHQPVTAEAFFHEAAMRNGGYRSPGSLRQMLTRLQNSSAPVAQLHTDLLRFETVQDGARVRRGLISAFRTFLGEDIGGIRLPQFIYHLKARVNDDKRPAKPRTTEQQAEHDKKLVETISLGHGSTMILHCMERGKPEHKHL